MKYILLDTPDGRRLPILFPDVLTHCFVAGAMQLAVDTLDPKKDLRPRQLDDMLERGSAKVISAGFVNLGLEISVRGKSESLGGISSRNLDAAYIAFGDAVAFAPDEVVEMLWEQAKG